jgi:hypothetical protein
MPQAWEGEAGGGAAETRIAGHLTLPVAHAPGPFPLSASRGEGQYGVGMGYLSLFR